MSDARAADDAVLAALLERAGGLPAGHEALADKWALQGVGYEPVTFSPGRCGLAHATAPMHAWPSPSCPTPSAHAVQITFEIVSAHACMLPVGVV